MTDKEYSKQKKRINAFYDKWAPILGMGWYKVNLLFIRDTDTNEPETAAITSSQSQYRLASIRFFMPIIASQSDEDLEHIIVHELCHILIAPLSQFTTDEPATNYVHEYSTECFAWALEHAYKAGQNAV